MGKALPPILVLLAAALVWFLMAGPSTATSDPDDGTPHGTAPPPTVRTGTTNAPSTSGPDRATVKGKASAAPRDDATTLTLSGRCLDQDGRPLAGATARLSTRYNSPWLRAWTAPEPVTTGADGRFALRFVATPKRMLRLELTAVDRPQLHGNFMGLRASKDLGDITLVRTCIVRGRIVDVDGALQPDTPVALVRKQPERQGELQETTYASVRSTADGTFRLAPLRPGEYSVLTRESILAGPKTLVIPDSPELATEVRIESTDRWPAIHGRLVDGQRAPIAGARVFTFPRVQSVTNRSRADGSFVILRPRGDESKTIHVAAAKLGFVDLRKSKPIAWGSRDVVLTLQRAKGLEIRVTNHREVVEDFAVWISVARGAPPRHFLRPRIPDHRGHHENGRLLIDDLRDGEYDVKVLPVDPRLAASEFQRVKIDATKRAELQFDLKAAVSRDIVVRYSSGEPVPTAKVELLQSVHGEPIGPQTSLWQPGAMYPGGTLLWSLQYTDASGTTHVTGAPDNDYTLRVSGDAFRTALLTPVRLTDAGPVTVEVTRGATILATLTPPSFLQSLRALLPPDEKRQPGVILRRWVPATSSWERVSGTDGRRVPVQGGRFRFDNVPEGDWEVHLETFRSFRQSTHVKSIRLGTVRNVKPDERREVTFDASLLIPGRLTIEVELDGKPHANGGLYLQSEAHSQNEYLDAAGRTSTSVCGGHYRIQGYLAGIPQTFDAGFDVPPGGEITRKVFVRSRRIRIRLEGWSKAISVRLGKHRRHPLRVRDGAVTLPAVVGATQLLVKRTGSQDQPTEIGTLNVQAGRGTQEFVLKIPESLR